MSAETITVEFCGEEYAVEQGSTFSVGREADLIVDDNQYLHRKIIELSYEAGIWWISNVGSAISVGLSGGDGAYQAWIGPGVRVPVVFSDLAAIFTAGPVTYELAIRTSAPAFQSMRADESAPGDNVTIGQTSLTPSQRLLIVALAEPLLREKSVGVGRIPTSASAAARLGWPLTTFNRKLDNVCDKLDRHGVPGMRGGVGNLATNRKARLVEHAVLSRLVTATDLRLLDAANPRDLAAVPSIGERS